MLGVVTVAFTLAGLLLLFTGAGASAHVGDAAQDLTRRELGLARMQLGAFVSVVAVHILPWTSRWWHRAAVLGPAAGCVLFRFALPDVLWAPLTAWFVLAPLAIIGLVRALRS